MATSKLPKSRLESKRFEASRKRIESDCERFDDLVDGLLNSISIKPDFFKLISKNGLQSARASLPDNNGEIRNIVIFFKDLPKVIYLVDVAEEPEE